jgi:hypothetical protein
MTLLGGVKVDSTPDPELQPAVEEPEEPASLAASNQPEGLAALIPPAEDDDLSTFRL